MDSGWPPTSAKEAGERGSENEKGFEGVEEIPPTVMREFRENMENSCDRSTRPGKPREICAVGAMPRSKWRTQKEKVPLVGGAHYRLNAQPPQGIFYPVMPLF
ncbi:hypothetical protein AVEN_37879-1 [Araneus ventricosus]|uniref:Uncharacterized protein n=1 Tax=Araneus ventricosus TaxID=182803 RepID=A0A4Y2R334_ARAVE|nr:hypothetical protein AVEN_37879-1 [Araneus ventricosus]